MLKYEDVAIHMNLDDVKFIVGNYNITYKSLKPFDDRIVSFFDSLSRRLMYSNDSKKYPDVITFAFFIRKANVLDLKNKYYKEIHKIEKCGRGIVFHIAPSNVPVNFAYSLFAGLICGNVNIIKVSSKEFEQVDIICNAISDILKDYEDIKGFINIVKYNNDKAINDYFSAICDVRVIWGGDNTISILRESKLKARAREITFADRYSFAIIDLDYYSSLSHEIKNQVAKNFYNDTYLSDQNACTSPRLLVFLGDKSLKDDFYNNIYDYIKDKYRFESVFSTSKLLDATDFLVKFSNTNPKLIQVNDNNLILRLLIDNIDERIVEFEGKNGLFVEYDCENLNDLKSVCNNDKVQTISYLGSNVMFDKLFELNLKGIDRIVPIGKTMDFNLVWDGYNLIEMLTRNIESI